MTAIYYKNAINNFLPLINNITDNFDEVIITTDENKNVVMISQDEYNSLKETIYLLSSKNNRSRLNESINEIENANFIKKELNI